MTDTPTTVTPITVARGNGIGPEIMDVTLEILSVANAPFDGSTKLQLVLTERCMCSAFTCDKVHETTGACRINK